MLNQRLGGWRRRQRGLSLVELMVGVAVGLFVVAGAATVTATQFSDSRRLVVETQIQQDLRATADIMTREIRRAGQWNSAANAVWAPAAVVSANGFAPVSQSTTSDIAIQRESGGTVAGFRRRALPPGVIEMDTGSGGWQALTDATTMDVTNLTIDIVPVQIDLSCPAECPAGTPGGVRACWPQLEVREVRIAITARALSDAAIVRSVRTATRLRNDRVINRNGGGALCPT